MAAPAARPSNVPWQLGAVLSGGGAAAMARGIAAYRLYIVSRMTLGGKRLRDDVSPKLKCPLRAN